MGEKGLLHSHMKTFFAIHLVNHTVAWRYGHAPLKAFLISRDEILFDVYHTAGKTIFRLKAIEKNKLSTI